MNILIVSASMGAGHDGAARELRQRLEGDGHTVVVKDYLKAFPLGIGRIVRFSYKWELQLAPWSYDATYRLWYTLPSMVGPLSVLLTLLTGRRVRRWIGDSDARAVVSTYPLASLVLGRARRRRRLQVPVTTFITDFAVHPLWAAPGVDLHLAVHPRAAESARAQTGAPAFAPGPLVSARFTAGDTDRASARAALGLPADQRIALLVAGSWGVGDMRPTFDEILATDTWLPLVVCGNNDRLRQQLRSRRAGWVYGWTDEMPSLMAAADVLVENAGGLTCMEAFACGLPVVSYRAIAGHGRGNAREMEAAGVVSVARPDTLAAVLDSTLGATGARQRAEGHAMFAGDAAVEIVELAHRWVAPVAPVAPAASAASAGVVVPARRRAPRARVVRPIAALAASAAAVVLAVTTASVGAGIAAAHGVAVAHPPRHATSVYLGVRLGPAAAGQSGVASALAAAHLTAIVSGELAAQHPAFVADLARAGCDVANGGWGRHRGHALTWARADVQRAGKEIREATGGRVRLFAPGRTVTGFELVSAEWDDERVVLPRTLVPAAAGIPAMHPGGIYVIDAGELSAPALLAILTEVRQLETAGELVAPLSALRG